MALSLASILAGIGVLSHHALRSSLDLGMATRQVTMELKLTRIRAVVHNTNQRLVFAPRSSVYQVQHKEGAVYVDAGPPIALPNGITVVDCTARESAISFRPRGNAATFGTITIQNDAGETRQVVVDIAGEIRMR